MPHKMTLIVLATLTLSLAACAGQQTQARLPPAPPAPITTAAADNEITTPCQQRCEASANSCMNKCRDRAQEESCARATVRCMSRCGKLIASRSAPPANY